MSKIVPVKFGPRSTDVDVEGKKYGELLGILATIHDTEVPANVEIYANEKPILDMETEIPDGISCIELTALAGKKQN